MDIENLKSWASQPDVCRCCLSTSGTWDMTASYKSDAIKEVYFEMLKNSFGITLSYLTEWGPSRMVCKLCVGHLREACSFREQVLRAEEYFLNYWTTRELQVIELSGESWRRPMPGGTPNCETFYKPGKKKHIKTIQELHLFTKMDVISDTSVTIKTEEALQESSPIGESYESDKRPSDDEETHKNDNACLAAMKSEKENKKRKRQKTNRARRKKKRTETGDDYDSDAPIAAMIEKNEPSADGNKDENVEGGLNETPLPDKRPERVIRTKQVSERKRVMMTCESVIAHTTACPFRHHKSWFQCFFCPQDFIEINLLREHTSQTHENIEMELGNVKSYPRSLQIEISNLKCRNCHSNLTDVNEMTRHLEEVHQKVIYKECIADYKVDSSPYTCHLCKQEFHVFRTLTTHLNEHYANCICDVCGKSFLNSRRLKVHKRTHDIGQFPCTECGKILKTKSSKANHMETHSKRQMKCQICLKPMKHYNDRVKHMSEVHNITHKFKCPICNREYNVKHYLSTHMRQTHGHKNKKCPECNMAFITNYGLKKHMVKHTGVKPFSCSVCSKSYARNYTLREHMRAHQNQNERFLCQE